MGFGGPIGAAVDPTEEPDRSLRRPEATFRAISSFVMYLLVPGSAEHNNRQWHRGLAIPAESIRHVAFEGSDGGEHVGRLAGNSIGHEGAVGKTCQIDVGWIANTAADQVGDERSDEADV